MSAPAWPNVSGDVFPDQRRLEWKAEHLVRSRIVWENQRRLQEIEEMLAAFFGESA